MFKDLGRAIANNFRETKEKKEYLARQSELVKRGVRTSSLPYLGGKR